MQKQENFIRYSKENDNSKANGIDFSNYNVYYEKIVSGDKLKTLADWHKNDYNVTCQNSGRKGQQTWIKIP